MKNPSGGKKDETMRIAAVFFLACVLVAVSTVPAMAFATPATSDFGYDIYVLVVDQIMGGPVGFVGAAICLIVGIMLLIKQQVIPAGCAIIGAGILAKGDSIVSSLGVLC